MRYAILILGILVTGSALAQPISVPDAPVTLTPMEQRRQMLNKAMHACIGHSSRDAGTGSDKGPISSRPEVWEKGYEHCAEVKRMDGEHTAKEEATAAANRPAKPSATNSKALLDQLKATK